MVVTAVESAGRRRGRRRSRAGRVRVIAAYVLTLLIVSPLLIMVSDAFKTEADAFSVPPKIIFKPTLAPLTAALHAGYPQALLNSVIDVAMSTLLCLVLGVPAAFGLAFYKYRNNDRVIFWILSTKFMPAVGVIVPLYVLFNNLHMLDTQTVLIVLYTAMNLPLVVLIMRSYYLDIPREIVEAAQVDGAGSLRLFLSVVGPIALPGAAASALLSVIFAWNEFFFAQMLTSTRAATLPVFISAAQTGQSLGLASVSAASLLAVAPLLVLGWIAQRHLAEGFTLGAVK